MTLVIVLASVVAYLAVGALACRYTVPRGIQRSYDYWHARRAAATDSLGNLHREFAVNAGAAWRAGTLLAWWVTVPATFMLSGKFIRETASFAPWAREQTIADREAAVEQREREIAKLERELGIGQP